MKPNPNIYSSSCREAQVQSLTGNSNTSFSLALLVLALLLAIPAALKASPQDLTTTNLASFYTLKNYNLGPTGMRGWMLSDAHANAGLVGKITAGSWQILVVAVGTNTPASGIMASNDVILGLSTGAGTPVTAWTYSATNDVRKSLGWAIGAAEAGDGKLNIKRWRAGVTTDVTLQLGLSNLAYSATAPYDCPKSAIILSNACNVIATKSFIYYNGKENGYPGSPALALALLASGNTNYLPQVQTYARNIAPANLSLTYTAPVGGGQPNGVGHSMDVWGWGYNGVFLAEYYLLTGDTNVLHGINQFTLGLAQGQGRYGTMGHGCSLLDANGNLHGTIPPYGPVNSCGVIANLAIVMGKKAIVASGGTVDPEIPAAIDRAAKFFGFYVQKGGIPYGEHEPGYFHAGNGKDNSAGMLFAMMGDQPVATEYFTRLTVAGHNGREYGHTGQGFSYLWDAMAANVGGTNAVASYLAQVRWHLDLSRRSDGSFVYDGSEQYGGSDTYDYWNSINYNQIDPTASHVLTFALAKQKLLLTGKNADPTNWLSSAKVTNAIWAGALDQVIAGYNTNQLVAALSEYDPLVRRLAAATLGTNASASYSMLTNLASSTNALLREAACQTLGYMQNTAALPLLGQRLTDTNVWVRAQAATALRNFSAASATQQLTNMLVAFVTNATDPNVIVWEDPLQNANRYLSLALFGNAVADGSPGNNVAAYTINANTNLLYPAVRVGLKQPDSYPRSGVAQFAYDYLSLTDVKALIPDLIEVSAKNSQADVMWYMSPRAIGIATLAKYNIAEGSPVALNMLNVEAGFDWNHDGFVVPALNALATYGDAAHWTLPTLRGYAATWNLANEYATDINALAATITSISNAITSPAGLTNLFAVASSQVVVTTNATGITLTGFSCRTASVTFTNVTAPAHGILIGTAPNLTYIPVGGYTGVDSFTFQTSDALTTSAPGTVNLIVGMSAGNGLKGEYFDNLDFTTLKFTRTDAQVNFDWGTGSPDVSMAADTFSVRWSGLLLAPETGNYTFSTLNSDGVRLHVNGVPVMDDLVDQTTIWNDGAAIALTAGQQYEVQMDYYENTGSAVAKLKWTGPSFAGSNGVLIAQQWLFDGTGISNRAAIVYPQSVFMVQNTNVAITLQGAGTNLTYSINTTPAHGSLSGTPPNVIYTPATNYNGTDSFTFVGNNGVSNSVPATVSITIWAGLPVGFYWTNTSGIWSVAANWTNTTGAAVAPDATGQAFYNLNFNQTGSYSATNNLNNGFLLNQLNFAGSVTLAGANALALAGNGPTPPQINQNSGNGVTINTPLSLSANTTFGGAGNGGVTISGVISGAGSLTKTNAGTLTLSGTNTYTGGTMINAGALACGLQDPSPLGGAGSVNVTVQSGATLSLNRNQITGSLTLNGGTVLTGNGWGDDAWNGPIVLAATSTIDVGSTDGSLAVTGVVSGPGGLIKLGTSNRVMPLSGTNTYTGPTLINAGTLSFTKSVSLGVGALSISDGAFANLNYSGTRIITALTLGGTNQPYGIYGSTNSTATFKDTHFTGTGTITVPPLVTLTNSPATVITDTSATLNATLGCTGTNVTVYAHWNTINGGTNTALWTNAANVGAWTNVASTDLSYTATGLTPNSTYYFTFRGTNSGGNLWPTNVLVFTTYGPPVITGQPVSVTNYMSTPATFTVTAIGAGLGYQWKKGAASLSNGGNVSGATTATLTLTGVNQTDATNYSVVISNAYGTVTSATATLTVIDPPFITGQPVSITNNAGTTANFTITTIGGGLSYQWKKGAANLSNGGNVSGATTATLMLTGVSQSDAASYSVVVTNTYGTATSATATLTVMDPPVITGQPLSLTNNAGTTANFTVTATGTALVYQWKKGAANLADGGNVSGATTATLTLTNISQVEAAGYSVVITNMAGSVTSSTATLTVIARTLAWDANGTGAAQTDGAGTWINTTNTWLDGSTNVNWVDGNDAIIGNGGAGGTITLGAVIAKSLTFTNFTGTYTLTNGSLTASSAITANSASGNITIHTPLAGAAGLTKAGTGTLSLNGANTYSGGSTVSNGALTLGAQTGLGSGPVTLAGGSTFQQINFEGNSVGGALPNAFVLNGGMATMNIPFSFKDVWISNTVSGSGGFFVQGGNRSLTLTANNTFSGGVTVNDGNRLQIGSATALGTGPLKLGNSGGGYLNPISNLTGSPVANSINLASGWILTVDTSSGSLELSGAITNTGGVTKTGNNSLTLSGANTYSGATTISAGTLALSGSGSLASPLITIGSGATLDVSGLGATFNLVGGQTLANSSSTTGGINGNLNTASGTILVSYASGTPSLTVANGTLTLAAGTTFTVNNTGAALVAGSYKLISKGTAGSVGGTMPAVTVTGGGIAGGTAAVLQITSGELFLTVISPPAITGQPLSVTNNAGTTAIFTVTATGTLPVYQWKKGAATLSNGGNVSGATTATLTLTGVSQADAAGYSVVITNAAGTATSATATLTVIDPPVITSQPASRTNNAGTTATFSVTATGTAPVYQWKKGAATLSNGGNVSGATTATLTLTSVSQTDAAGYSVVITNAAGTVTSASATLTVIGLPSPWLTADIGAVGLVGSASENSGTYTVNGSGTGITGTADQFRYVYQTMSGDGSIKARIVSQSSTLAASLAGVMIRETTNANSMFAMSGHRGSGTSNMRALRRTSTGGSMTSTSTTSMTPANCWVQVTRTGNSLAMMSSTNGTTWTTNNTSTVTMAANITVGLISTSSSNTALNTNVFDNITVVP